MIEDRASWHGIAGIRLAIGGAAAVVCFQNNPAPRPLVAASLPLQVAINHSSGASAAVLHYMLNIMQRETEASPRPFLVKLFT